MNKSELLAGLREKHERWQALLAEIGPARMDQPGVNGSWSMKDLVGHLTGWNRKLLADLQAAQRAEPGPPPPWPPSAQTEDEVNAWIYESYRTRSASDVLDETDQVIQQILMAVEQLPADVRTQRVEPAYYLLWIDDKRFLPGEFFDHFHDDHEPNVRAWLAQQSKH